MCSLGNFPPPPADGYVTVCEKNAEMVAFPKGDLEQNQYLQEHNFPIVNVSEDLHRPSLSKESARSAFLEHEDTPRKRLLRAWYEHGLTGVLEELANGNTFFRSQGPSWTSFIARSVLATVRWTTSLHGSLFPHLAMSSDDLISEFSSNPNWKQSYIRCFAWHPHAVKFAIALLDDSVKVYSARKHDIVPTLKHKMQQGVADIAWKPLSASLLAVACQSCVLIWNVDPTSLATRPSTSSVQVLSQPGHCPVTSLAWCPRGGVLVTASPTNTSMMVWDVAMERSMPLRRVGGGGVSLLRWSPDGSKLLSACPTSMFRVWETQRWDCERWSKLCGRCQAACWSPDGSVLLFATADDPVIYSLTFSRSANESHRTIGGSKIAIDVINTAQVEIESEDGKISVGGAVQNMAWDPRAERLAVQFKGHKSYLIALFQTRLEPALELIPCGFVRGKVEEMPHLMSFQPRFSEGSLLTVVWSSGRISYLPLYYVPRNEVDYNRLYIQQQVNGLGVRSPIYSTMS